VTLIVDTSVALKWVLEEDGTDRARALLVDVPLAATDLLWIECANVLWVKSRRGQISAADARAAHAALDATPVRVVPSAALGAAALAIALELGHPAYDCLFLAAALDETATLVSADHAFVMKAAAHPAFAGFVRRL
jgi:predicted nucleic acid-binding protein